MTMNDAGTTSSGYKAGSNYALPRNEAELTRRGLGYNISFWEAHH